MPIKPLLSAGFERVLNKALALSVDSQVLLAPLQGKSLKVAVNELPWPLTLHFSQQIDVLFSDNSADCFIQFSLADAHLLKDTANLSRLIQQNKLTLEGELQVAQKTANVFSGLTIDWEEHLSTWLGDVPAHQLVTSIKQLHFALKSQLAKTQAIISNAALEEKKLAAHKVAVSHYNQQITDLRSRFDRLEQRVAQLSERADA